MRHEIAEPTCEGFLLGIVQMSLIAEEDDLVFQKKLVDCCHRCIRKITAKADAFEFGSDTAGQRYDIGLGNDLIDENRIAHGNLLLILEEVGRSPAPKERFIGRSKSHR